MFKVSGLWMNQILMFVLNGLYNLFIKQSMNQPFGLICYYEPFFASLTAHYTSPPLLNQVPPHYFILPPSNFPQSQPFHQNKSLIETFAQFDSLVAAQRKVEVKSKIKAGKKSGNRADDENFGLRTQNKNRNINSNILKSYLKYASDSVKMEVQVQKIAGRLKIENGVSRFQNYLEKQFPSRRCYVGLRYVQGLVGARRGEEAMGVILGVTLRSYLSKVYPLETVFNQEMKRREKLEALKRARAIAATLFKK